MKRIIAVILLAAGMFAHGAIAGDMETTAAQAKTRFLYASDHELKQVLKPEDWKEMRKLQREEISVLHFPANSWKWDNPPVRMSGSWNAALKEGGWRIILTDGQNEVDVFLDSTAMRVLFVGYIPEG